MKIEVEDWVKVVKGGEGMNKGMVGREGRVEKILNDSNDRIIPFPIQIRLEDSKDVFMFAEEEIEKRDKQLTIE